MGPYSLEVKAAGFKNYVQSGIVLQVGSNVALNVQLQLGTVSETVEVTAGASMVDTTQTTIGQVIDQRRIVDLPLNGRQPTQLVLLAGASVVAPSTPTSDINTSKNFYSSTTISVAGGQSNGTNYILDGGDNNDVFTNVNLPFPFPEALQEFKVETSTLPARYGLHPGGVVNMVTRSGSNDWHGDLFEYIRNGDLNARNYFAPTQDSLKRNQFGGDIGGHIIRDKLFLFTAYQGTRNRQNPTSNTSFIPTAATLAGNFSVFDSGACVSGGQGRALINPTTGQAFPGNQIPTSMFNPQALAIVTKYLPQTTDPCGRVTYGIPTTGDDDQIIGRVDWIQNQKHSLYGRYFVDDYRNPAAFVNNNLLTTTRPGNLERAQSMTIGDTYTFNATTVNAFHATFTRLRNDRGPAYQNTNPTELGVNVFSYVPANLEITVGSSFSIGCGSCAPAYINRNAYQFADDVDLVRGPHQLSFGVDAIRAQVNSFTPSDANGNYTFNGQFTGDAVADFLLGDLSNFDQSAARTQAFRQTILGFYVQDVYRVNSRITINAGLRWEPYFAPYTLNHAGSVFDLSAFYTGKTSSVFTNAPPGSFYYGDPGIPRSLTKGTLLNLSPRLGLVFSPTKRGHDTIRVGGAILKDVSELYFTNHTTFNPPFGDSIYLTSPPGGFTNPWAGYPGGDPFPVPNPPPANSVFPAAGQFIALPTNSLTPTTIAEWNASYEHQFTNNWLLTASYMGNKTSHHWDADELNPAVYIPGTCNGAPCSTTANTNQRRMLTLANPTQGGKYGDLELLTSGGNANYNAALVSVERRFTNNVSVLANYTWSHCISDYDFEGDVYTPVYEIPFNRAADRASCTFDVRHLFNLSAVAVSSFKSTGIVAALLRNWQLAPIVRYQSGAPLNVLTGSDNSRTGQNLDRPNLVLSNPYPAVQSSADWINRSAFAPNAIGTFGNLGRNALTGPGFFQFDAALSRLFAVRERLSLEARFEAFNVLNWVNFNAPTVTLSSSQFGQIRSAGDPRILQFALKIHF